MRISVECGARNRYEGLKQILASSSDPKYTFREMDPHNPIAMIFETDSDDEKKVLMEAERLIRSASFGKLIAFRVVPAGAIVYYKPR